MSTLVPDPVLDTQHALCPEPLPQPPPPTTRVPPLWLSSLPTPPRSLLGEHFRKQELLYTCSYTNLLSSRE